MPIASLSLRDLTTFGKTAQQPFIEPHSFLRAPSRQPSMSQKHYHQDYIARIRYSNALPPPPFNPKFLDIPKTGLSSGDYTTTKFASRLAREYPANIEADAELGMPLDLIGIKGVFDGDETGLFKSITYA